MQTHQEHRSMALCNLYSVTRFLEVFAQSRLIACHLVTAISAPDLAETIINTPISQLPSQDGLLTGCKPLPTVGDLLVLTFGS